MKQASANATRRLRRSVPPREVSFLCVVFLLCAAVLTVQQVRHTFGFPVSHATVESDSVDSDAVTLFLMSSAQRHLYTVHQHHGDPVSRPSSGGSSGGSSGSDQTIPRLTLPLDALPPLTRLPRSLPDALRVIRQLRLARNERATFIQLGANDGITNDPLYKAWVLTPNGYTTHDQQTAAAAAHPHVSLMDHRRDWMGLQVEPQPLLFDQMRHDIGSPTDWYYYNGVVVANEQCVNQTVYFCETKTPGQGDWFTQGQINSVRPDKCLKARNQDKMHLVPRPCVSSLNDLVAASVSANGPNALPASFVSSLDLLQIDTEGHDLDILQLLFSTTTIRPLCLNYEHWGAGAAALALVTQHGYTVVETKGSDRLACRVQASNARTST